MLFNSVQNQLDVSLEKIKSFEIFGKLSTTKVYSVYFQNVQWFFILVCFKGFQKSLPRIPKIYDLVVFMLDIFPIIVSSVTNSCIQISQFLNKQ